MIDINTDRLAAAILYASPMLVFGLALLVLAFFAPRGR